MGRASTSQVARQLTDPDMTPPSEHERSAGAATQESGPRRPQLMQDPQQRAHKAALAAQLFGEAPAVVKIGRFRVLGRLGEGGMGVVFSGHDDELDRRVAIKLLHWTRQEDRDARARLRREAQALARLSHPNVVQLFEVGEHEGRMFVAMEYVAGETLHAWLRAHRGPRPWREVLGKFVAAGRGLAAAHTVGLVHRDFKPSNVILGADGRVRVLDFGLARAAGEQEAIGTLPEGHVAEDSRSPLATPLTLTGGVLGTPAYMAPEQFGGRCDARSDQFGFCVALFEALYGERPFAGTRPGEIVAAIERGEPVKASSGTVPGWLHAAVVRGLSREPEQRWPSMPALLDELARDRDGRRRIRAVGLTAGLGATAAVLGAALGIGQVQESRRVAACEALGAEIEAVWGPAQRERLIAGYEATGASTARIAMGRWLETIDAHAERWRWRRIESCVAPSSEVGEWPYMQKNVERCFVRAREQLATLVEVVTRATPALKDPLASLAWYAPEIDGCVDDAQIKKFAGDPEDPALRGRRQEIRGRMIEGDLAAQGGRTQEAEALLGEALAAARELEDTDLALTGSRLLARARFAGGRRRQAWDALVEGVPWSQRLDERQMWLWRSELRAPLLLGEATDAGDRRVGRGGHTDPGERARRGAPRDRPGRDAAVARRGLRGDESIRVAGVPGDRGRGAGAGRDR
jgi:predicted Ser/Thr protein kinase